MTQATARKSVTSLSTATASHQQQQLNAQKRASAVDLISGGVQFARASSHDSHHGSQSEFSRSVLVYTLFGATLLGGSLGVRLHVIVVLFSNNNNKCRVEHSNATSLSLSLVWLI